MVKTRALPAAIDKRRGDVERINDAHAQWFHVSGEVIVDGAGESTVSVLFPVFFVDKPRFSFGGELAPGEALVAGSLPTCSVCVLEWEQRARTDSTIIYAGATLCIVTTGPTGQQMSAFWHMEGVGLRGPSSP